MNVAELLPASTVTLAGTEATAVFVDSSVTTVSTAVGAFRFTVPVTVALDPPVNVEGATPTFLMSGSKTVKTVDSVLPLFSAERVTAVSVATL